MTGPDAPLPPPARPPHGHTHTHTHTHSHGPPADLAAHLAQAAVVCADAGETFTPLRRRVLELLLEAGGATKAYDLLDKLGAPGGPARPPTVYRALEFLVRLGLAHKIESLNAFVACHVGSCDRTTVFLICERCRRTEEADAGHASVDVNAAAAAAGFILRRTILEAYGVCPACRTPA